MPSSVKIEPKRLDFVTLAGAVHQAYWRLFRTMIAGLIELIQAEQNRISPAENADDVASNLINQLLDLEVPNSNLLGLALMRYAAAYLLFEEGVDRDALVQLIKDI